MGLYKSFKLKLSVLQRENALGKEALEKEISLRKKFQSQLETHNIMNGARSPKSPLNERHERSVSPGKSRSKMHVR